MTVPLYLQAALFRSTGQLSAVVRQPTWLQLGRFCRCRHLLLPLLCTHQSWFLTKGISKLSAHLSSTCTQRTWLSARPKAGLVPEHTIHSLTVCVTNTVYTIHDIMTYAVHITHCAHENTCRVINSQWSGDSKTIADMH